jgi:hypothetical protein
MRHILVLTLILLPVAEFANASDILEWRTEQQLGRPVPALQNCNIATDSNCADIVVYEQQSKFGVTFYLTYYEGTRASIGFGSKRNEANQILAESLHSAAFDWGGYVHEGKFVPRYVIKRFYSLNEEDQVDKRKTRLSVYRLTDDGGSCLIQVDSETSDIRVARKQADHDMGSPKCLAPWQPVKQ